MTDQLSDAAFTGALLVACGVAVGVFVLIALKITNRILSAQTGTDEQGRDGD